MGHHQVILAGRRRSADPTQLCSDPGGGATTPANQPAHEFAKPGRRPNPISMLSSDGFGAGPAKRVAVRRSGLQSTALRPATSESTVRILNSATLHCSSAGSQPRTASRGILAPEARIVPSRARAKQSESVVPSGCHPRGSDRCAADASRSRNAQRTVARSRTLSSNRNWPEIVVRSLLCRQPQPRQRMSAALTAVRRSAPARNDPSDQTRVRTDAFQ